MVREHTVGGGRASRASVEHGCGYEGCVLHPSLCALEAIYALCTGLVGATASDNDFA